ncbi:MAG: hypothetical protein NWQ40_04055 [Schleiferiaceae bacterium]|jgi:hypothetical protein|nr:hypothetical protein [Schleiferiaceae bacterium]
MSPKDVDKLFREALSEGQATPRPEAWARVAASLPKAEPEAQPKRRTLWWPYAAAASVAIAAVGTWWMQAPGPEASSTQLLVSSNQKPETSNESPATSNQLPVSSNQSQVARKQQPAASNQLPATSNQLPATSNQLLVAGYSKDFALFDVAFLPRMEADALEESVPLLKRQVMAVVQTPAPKVPRPRYLQLAANVQNVWTAVQEYREAEVPAAVTVEVHLPAPVLQRINQTKMLASNLNQSWSTLQSRRSR